MSFYELPGRIAICSPSAPFVFPPPPDPARFVCALLPQLSLSVGQPNISCVFFMSTLLLGKVAFWTFSFHLSVSINTSVLFLLWTHALGGFTCSLPNTARPSSLHTLSRHESVLLLRQKPQHAGASKTLGDSFKRKQVAWTQRVSVSPQLVKYLVYLREISPRPTPFTQSRLVCFWPLVQLFHQKHSLKRALLLHPSLTQSLRLLGFEEAWPCGWNHFRPFKVRIGSMD